MYKIWRSKQHTDFCGTRVQVGKYSGLEFPDKKCPNCGWREAAEHILICPDKDRTHLLVETTDDLSKWLNQENLTDIELAYWIPKYILMKRDCRRPSRYVPYKGTFVPYDGTFGASDQGQTLDV
jgi:hypothetical protein